jgi:hypothetical protein
VTALSDLLSEHRPWSSHRCRCGWEGDRFDVHLHDMLIVPANREALVSGLIDAKVLVHSDLWAVPADPGEELARLAELPATDDEAELDRRFDEEGLLREALTRTSHVYLEHEPRPQCARALYEIGGGA